MPACDLLRQGGTRAEAAAQGRLPLPGASWHGDRPIQARPQYPDIILWLAGPSSAVYSLACSARVLGLLCGRLHTA